MKRMRIRGFNHGSVLPLILGGVGLGILIFAIPWRVWLVLIGLGLVGGAYYLGKDLF